MSENPHSAVISTAVIGAGGWGKNLIRVFSSLPRSHLKYVCDVNRERLDTVRALYQNVTVTDDFETVLQDDSVKAVIIATPADTHYTFIKRSLETGRLHVFTEKPLTLSVEESLELIDLAKETGSTLMVGHLMLYHPAVNYLKELIRSGELGEIYCIYTHRLNLGIIRKVEDAWWSLAPHDISILNYLLDAVPEGISVQGQSYIQPGVVDIVFATLNYPKNTIVNIHVSWLDPHKMRKVTIVGSKKMAIFDDMNTVEKVRIYDKGIFPNRTGDRDQVVSYEEFFKIHSGDVLSPTIAMEEPLKLECEHFLDSILNGTTPLSDGANGVEVVKTLAAGESSMKSGGKSVKIS